MDFLLDTCTFIWLCAEPKNISDKCREILDSDEENIFISDVSTLEISLKWQSKKLTLPMPPRIWIQEMILTWNLNNVSISREDIFKVSELPIHHKDPFDRLLAAQCINNSFRLLTPDPALKDYPISTIW